MVEDGESEREKRVKRNAETSLSLSKLPPRMEEDFKKREQKAAEIAKLNQSAASFAFRPPLPKAVPDFKRLHKEFAATMDQNKSAVKLTVPKPFNFHEPKNDPSLRKYMDNDNIPPTMH